MNFETVFDSFRVETVPFKRLLRTVAHPLSSKQFTDRVLAVTTKLRASVRLGDRYRVHTYHIDTGQTSLSPVEISVSLRSLASISRVCVAK